MRAEQSALIIWPPGTPGSGLFNETFSTDIPLTTSPATLTQPNALLPLPVTGSFIRFCPDTDCYVRFAATAALCGAATVNDWFWGAGIVVDHWCEPGRHDWFAVIAKTTIGKFKRYRTNEY
jgi:hypothetical protein